MFSYERGTPIKWRTREQSRVRRRRTCLRWAEYPSRGEYKGTSLIRNSAPLGPCGRTMRRALWQPYWGGVGCFLWARYSCRLRCHSLRFEHLLRTSWGSNLTALEGQTSGVEPTNKDFTNLRIAFCRGSSEHARCLTHRQSGELPFLYYGYLADKNPPPRRTLQ
jgi:hypothetical protein